MIRRFLALSLTLHALFAAAWALRARVPPVAIEAPTLHVAFAPAVSLPAPQGPARAAPKAMLKPVPRTGSRNAVASELGAARFAALESAPVEPAAPETASRDSAAAPDSDAGNSRRANHLLSLLRGALDRNFIYPPLARKHGWQGAVQVGLRLDTSGRLGALRLLRSSGYAILDRDALSTLERIGSIPQARAWLDDRPYETELTVIYRLIGS